MAPIGAGFLRSEYMLPPSSLLLLSSPSVKGQLGFTSNLPSPHLFFFFFLATVWPKGVPPSSMARGSFLGLPWVEVQLKNTERNAAD